MKKAISLFLHIITILSLTIAPLISPVSTFAQVPGGSPRTYFLRGTIFGDGFDTPLFGAGVALVNKNTQSVVSQNTNSAGEFAFIVPPGEYALNVIARGYMPGTQSVSLTATPITTYLILTKLQSGTTGDDSPPIVTGGPSSGSSDSSEDGSSDGSSSNGSGSSSGNGVVNADGNIVTKSNCVVTIIGKPKVTPVLPPECNPSNNENAGTGGIPADSNGILPWAEKITSALRRNLWDYLNNQEADICNTSGYCANKRTGNDEGDLYWCTFLVIDTYNLIGKKGLNPDEHLGVVYMMPFFKTTSGYLFLAYDPYNTTEENKNTLRNVKPGMPWFLAYDPTQTISQEHTGLVYSISVDSNGNGEIVTRESNSNETTHNFPIDGWNVITFDGYPLRGFGGIQ